MASLLVAGRRRLRARWRSPPGPAPDRRPHARRAGRHRATGPGRHRGRPSRARRSGARGGSPAAPDLFTLGFLTRTVPGRCRRGRRSPCPTRRYHWTVTVRRAADTETLSSIAAQLLSVRAAHPRGAALGGRIGAAQRAAGAGGARRPGDRAGHARPATPVSASHLHALSRPGRPRHAVPAVSGGQLPHQPGHHRRSAPHADHRHRTGQSVVHDVSDPPVPAADRRRHRRRLRDRPLPGDSGLPAVPRPYFQELAAPGAAPGGRPRRRR